MNKTKAITITVASVASVLLPVALIHSLSSNRTTANDAAPRAEEISKQDVNAYGDCVLASSKEVIAGGSGHLAECKNKYPKVAAILEQNYLEKQSKMYNQCVNWLKEEMQAVRNFNGAAKRLEECRRLYPDG